MSSDDHTIDLTAGVPMPSANGNGNHPLNGNRNGHSASNGNGRRTRVTVADEQAAPRGGELDGIEWFPSYERDSVEEHLRELDAERTRLEAEIADAERRTAVAEEALACRTAELEAGLGAVVVAARAELARIEGERDEVVAAIHAEAEAEAERIRSAARSEAETVRGAASSLAALGASGPTPQDPADTGRNASVHDEGRDDAG